MTTKDIQLALKAAGYDPGPIDGVRGRKTILAIKQFQAANGLTADGLVGLKTRELLFTGQAPQESAAAQIPSTLPWLEEAHMLLGVQERPGRDSNQTILDWAEDLRITAYDDDDIPWCGLFVAHCVGSQMTEEPLPTNPLGARQWADFGGEISPQMGAVMVFWRGSPDGWKGHVGFYWAEDDEAYHILGGNQSNSVSITRLAKNRLLSARWPDTAMAGGGVVRIASKNGELLSTNEA